jgi:hypothetical protein
MTAKNKIEDVFKYIDMSGGPDACWPWLGSINRKGLPYFTVDGRKVIAYRIVKFLAHGGFNLYDERIIPLHQCKDNSGQAIDNPLCCNPAHTALGTHEDNMIDMMLKGRSGLTKDAIHDILRLHDEHGDALTHGQIGKRIEYKHKVRCARQTVTDILNGRRRAMLQQRIRDEDATIEESGHDKTHEE